MGLEWIVLTTAVVFEAVLLLFVTLPIPAGMTRNVILAYRKLLQPLLAILPFAVFNLLDVYWKYEHRFTCKGEHCSTIERDRHEKSMYKSQRNGILSLAAIFLYWMLFRYVHSLNELTRLEHQVKSPKEEKTL